MTAWAVIDWTSDDQLPAHQAIAAAPAAAAVEPVLSQCAVTYQLIDDGRTFHALLTVAAQSTLPAGWRLALHLPAEHSAQISVGSEWRAVDGTLLAPAQPSLAGGRQTQLHLLGRHATANPLPAAATINNRSCTLMLLGPTGTPKGSTVVPVSQINNDRDQGHGSGNGHDDQGKQNKNDSGQN
jgi:hypothetical protein